MRGDPRAEVYYERLLEELKCRVEPGHGAVKRERIRLYWEGMPIWGRIRTHAHWFARQGAAVVASAYGDAWTLEGLDDPDPYEGMAKAYGDIFIARDDAYKLSALARATGDF